MPIYDYQCHQCQTMFEIRASFKEKDHGLKPVCPNCQSTEPHQILTAGLFLHQGSIKGASNPSAYCGPNSGSGCCG